MHHLKEEMEVLVKELKCNNSIIERSVDWIPFCHLSNCRDDADVVCFCLFFLQPRSSELGSSPGAKSEQTYDMNQHQRLSRTHAFSQAPPPPPPHLNVNQRLLQMLSRLKRLTTTRGHSISQMLTNRNKFLGILEHAESTSGAHILLVNVNYY